MEGTHRVKCLCDCANASSWDKQ